MAERKVINLEVTPEAKARFADFCDRLGVVQRTAASRLFAWFMDQPEELQAVIIGTVPSELREDAIVAAIGSMADAIQSEANYRKLLENMGLTEDNAWSVARYMFDEPSASHDAGDSFSDAISKVRDDPEAHRALLVELGVPDDVASRVADTPLPRLAAKEGTKQDG